MPAQLSIPSNPLKLNREAWLTEMARHLEDVFKGHFNVKPYRVTCGWPSSGGVGKRRRVIGQCHPPQSSKAGVFELFISPVLDSVVEVGGTLAHEMAHVVAGVDAQHGKEFVRVCVAVGLTKGRPASVGPGPRLEERIKRVGESLGPYPHQKMEPVLRRREVKKSRTRIVCSGCGCTATIGLKWIAEPGLPTCACGTPMSVDESQD